MLSFDCYCNEAVANVSPNKGQKNKHIESKPKKKKKAENIGEMAGSPRWGRKKIQSEIITAVVSHF